jgi:hypothetical protein
MWKRVFLLSESRKSTLKH